MSSNQPEFSIVFPCYNEAGNLEALIHQLDTLIAQKPIEVVLVNNGSTDASQEILAKTIPRTQNRDQFTLVEIKKNKGYGHGITTGLHAAKGRFLGYTHADLQCDPANVITGYELYLQTEKEIEKTDFLVKGQRHSRREEEKLFSTNLDRLASIVFLRPIHDINGQPKIFSRSFFENHLRHGPRDLTLDVFLMGKVAKEKIELKTFPVYFGVRKAGVSSWNTTFLSRVSMASRFAWTVFLTRFRIIMSDLK